MNNQKEQVAQAPSPPPSKVHIADFLRKSLESYTEFEIKWADTLAKFLTDSFGSLWFLNLTLAIIFLWIVANLGLVPGIEPFDLYPFGWLMMTIQIFAIVLSIVVLISQKRESMINEVYQKMDFEINVRAEREITKILHMIEEIHKKLGIAKIDRELELMKELTDISEIKENVEQLIEVKDKTNGLV